MELQKRGVPTVTVVTEKFVSLAKASASSMGYPDLPLVVVPHPFETLSRERLEALAVEKVEECIARVTRTEKVAA